MNIKIILYLLGKICFGAGIVQLIPFLAAIIYGESCYKEFLGSIIVAFIMTGLCDHYGQPSTNKSISVRDGIGAIFLAWVLAAFLAGLPYYFTDLLDPAAAYFEGMSGITTTGATTVADLTVFPKSLLLWRTLTHWFGGIGVIVLFVVLLPQITGSSVYLFNAEVSGFSNSRILPRIRTTGIALFYIYLLLTIILTGILTILGMDEFDAVNHAASTIATGGFSLYNNNIAHFDNAAIEIVLGIFMILSAGNFALYYQMTQSGVKALWEDLEFKTYLSMLLLFTVFIALNIIFTNGYSLSEGFRTAFFHVASISSTTGFVTENYDLWPSFSKLLLVVLLFMGGCAGSTAGGIKISRLIVLLKMMAAGLRRTLHPQMLLDVYYGKKVLPMQTVNNISRFFFMYMLVVAVFTLVLTACGLSIEQSLFGVISCVSCAGTAFAGLGTTVTFAVVPAAGKIALALAMLLGRLELFTVLVLLRSEYWHDDKRW